MSWEFPYIFMGDSIFALWKLPFKNVTNLGLSGSRIEHQRMCIEQSYSINHDGLILHVCSNNLGKGDSITETIGMYTTFLDYAVTVFDKIYCTSVLPINTGKYFKAWGNIKHYLNRSNRLVLPFNNAVYNLCKERSIEYIDMYQDFSENSEMLEKYNDDGTHPNTAGYSLMKDLLQAYITNLD